jgi:dolichyl-phosphate-mannose--protein O-mannosyl transferase
VIPLGNPLLWWIGVAALLWLTVLVARHASNDALPMLVGFAAGWLPWLYFMSRTTFTFYSVVFLPYTAMAVAKAAHLVAHRRQDLADRWRPATIGLVLAVAVLTAFFYPVLTGVSIPYSAWRLRMWLPSWI